MSDRQKLAKSYLTISKKEALIAHQQKYIDRLKRKVAILLVYLGIFSALVFAYVVLELIK